MAETTLHATVAGRVQGVGFRFFVLGTARRLGLQGSVRNLGNGQVEVRARGAEAALRELVGALHEGPPFSGVEHVEVTWGAAVPETAEFSIGF